MRNNKNHARQKSYWLAYFMLVVNYKYKALAIGILYNCGSTVYIFFLLKLFSINLLLSSWQDARFYNFGRGQHFVQNSSNTQQP